jgi:glycosyltransferase involved in cell wall biosynthesis
MGDGAAHVVMVVANDVATDTRVKKEALALAQAGLRVTVLGSASDTTPTRSWLGDVEIVRVPVDFTIRDAAQRQADAEAPPALIDPRTEAKVVARVARRQRAIKARSDLAVARRVGAASSGVAGAVGAVAFKIGVAERVAERAALKAVRQAARLQGGTARRLQRRAAAKASTQVTEQPTVVGWREQHPQILDYEVAFGPVLDSLAPDVIHAHDMHVVGIAAHARARAKAAGRDVPWVYDAHEYVPGLSQYGGRTAEVIAGWASLEEEFIRDAARVITVSPAIADALRERYDLATQPVVVLNIPTVDPPGAGRVQTLREVCGLAPDVPLLSYSGGMTRARGVHTAIDAMMQLPQAHLGLVCVPHNDTWFVRQLRQQVEGLGLGDRVHFVNPVGPGQVVDYLRGIDVGLIPGLSYPSHEMSLPNKLFEYLHAGVPVVSSDLSSLREFLDETGAGVTFPAEDVDALVAAVRAVLAEHERYAAAASDPQMLRRYSWSEQARELRRLYGELLGADLDAVATGVQEVDEVVDLTESDQPATHAG